MAPQSNASSTTASTVATTTEPPPVEVRVGDCLPPVPREVLAGADMSFAPVSCDEPHSTEVTFVGPLPEPWASRDQRPGPSDPDWYQLTTEHVHPTCGDHYYRYLGENPVVSNVEFFWFTSSEQGWDRGERWFQCHVASIQAEGVVERVGSLRGALDGVLTPDLRLCANLIGAEGEGQSLSYVPCAESHDVEFVHEVVLPATVPDGDLWEHFCAPLQRVPSYASGTITLTSTNRRAEPVLLCALVSDEPIEGIGFNLEAPRT